MRRILSFFTLASTLALASAVELSIIKAFNTPAEDKDTWSFKGTIAESFGQFTDELLAQGLAVDLESPNDVRLDQVSFGPSDCEAIRLNTTKAVLNCKVDGARLTIREAQNKTGTTYYKISANFKRRDFELATLATPLTVKFESSGLVFDTTTDDDCVKKEGGKGQLRATCRPGAN